MKIQNEDIPIVKLFIFDGRYFVYDTYSNYIFEVTREQYLEASQLLYIGLKAYMQLDKPIKAYSDIKMLIYKGLFQKSFIQEIIHPETKAMKYLIERSINNITLQVTRNCNFSCRYCLYINEHGYERNHEANNMSWEIAKKSIDFLFQHSCDAEVIEISFYGGEPLLNFSLISEVVNYANMLFYSKKVVYRTTINGSLLTDNVINFFIKHDFKFTISFDGKKETQNRHRRFGQFGNETYDVVYKNIMRIKEININYFRTNVSFIAVAFNDENKKEIIEFFDGIGVDIEKVSIQDADLDGIDYIESYKNITQYDISGDSNQILDTSMKLFDIIYRNKEKIPTKCHHGGPCIPGIRKLFIDVDGTFYPCEKIVEHACFSIGNLITGLDIDRIIKILNIGKLTEQKCKKCWAFRFCDICVANCNDIFEGTLSAKQKEKSCNDVKKRTLDNFKKYIIRKTA